jgi:hypothetical protein
MSSPSGRWPSPGPSSPLDAIAFIIWLAGSVAAGIFIVWSAVTNGAYGEVLYIIAAPFWPFIIFALWLGH